MLRISFLYAVNEPYFPKFSSLMLGKSLLYVGEILVQHQSFISHVFSVCKGVGAVLLLKSGDIEQHPCITFLEGGSS